MIKVTSNFVSTLMLLFDQRKRTFIPAFTVIGNGEVKLARLKDGCDRLKDTGTAGLMSLAR